jgi:segregation and condensation protein A
MSNLITMPIIQQHLNLQQLGQDTFEEPVEILVKLVKDGEIDPWNIDIVDITDRFLQRIEEIELMDLRISGRTLHSAAILLRMKSNILVEKPPDEDYSPVDDLDFFDIEDYPVPRPPLRRHSRRSVTLDELIQEFEKAEIFEQRRIIRKKVRETIALNKPTTDQVLGIAHEEDIESRIELLRKEINSLLKETTYITLSELLRGDRSNKLMTYISLLFIANMKEIWIEQEELFGELYIRYPEAHALERP